MKNSFIFASTIYDAMSDYQIHLDDDMVLKAEQILGKDSSFSVWLQKKVEQWLHDWLDNHITRDTFHKSGLSDEVLSEVLKDFPPLTQDAFPELSKSEFDNMVKSQMGRLPNGLEKWL